MEYFAFGETFIEEHKNSHNSPYKFNGKELDEESGLYYYGARYYDPRISIWASVDPLANYNPFMDSEHYIDGDHNGGVFNSFNHNSYGYCYQNPVKLVDPNGKQTVSSAINGYVFETTSYSIPGSNEKLILPKHMGKDTMITAGSIVMKFMLGQTLYEFNGKGYYNNAGEKYINPNPKPTTSNNEIAVLRFDGRDPEKVKEHGGFMARNTDAKYDYYKFLSGQYQNANADGSNEKTQYVSTSYELQSVLDFANENYLSQTATGYIYKMTVNESIGVNANASLNSAVPFSKEKEFTAIGGIPYSNITHYLYYDGSNPNIGQNASDWTPMPAKE